MLDTHVWIWISIERHSLLSEMARTRLQRSAQKWISAISLWELSKLVEKKRITFSIPTVDWIRRSLNESEIRIADLSPEIAVESTQLRDFHRDPADQIIVATSRVLGIPVLTSDQRILRFSDVEAVW